MGAFFILLFTSMGAAINEWTKCWGMGMATSPIFKFQVFHNLEVHRSATKKDPTLAGINLVSFVHCEDV